MRLSFLGTGAAGGVPLYGCSCAGCTVARSHPGRYRRPCSAEITHANTRIVLDAGRMDLHELYPPGSLSAFVLTHYHPDHVQGLFHLRWGQGPTLRVLAPPDSEGCADLFKHPGILAFEDVHKFESVVLGDLRLTPLPLIHSKPTLGYAVEASDGSRVAYLTDTVGLPPKTLEFLQNWGCFDLVIDCSFPPRSDPRGHNDWRLALQLIKDSGARHGWLTHIGHELDAWIAQTHPELPGSVSIAYDGIGFTPGVPDGPDTA
jgi:phosphoribosyl 1,2-cyclic phosphate phosphodiesterase